MKDYCVTRKSLILRASDPDDHNAFDEFVQYYEGFISAIIHKMGISSNDFPDLKQDLLLKLWKSLDKFSFEHENSRFRAWLRTVIRNGVYEFYRKTSRNKNIEMTDQLETYCVSEDKNELNNLIDEEWKNHVIQLALDHIRKMFTGCAVDVFMLTLEGVPVKDIAARFDIRESTVYNLRLRVKDKFQLELKNIRELLEFPGEKRD